MSSKKATFALALLFLLVTLYGGHDAVQESAARQLSTSSAKPGPPRLGGIVPDCSTLSVTALTPNVTSVRSVVGFQVSVAVAPLWCGWTASSDLITDITPPDGVGTQTVKGILPPNLNQQPRTAVFTVTSDDGTVVRTATVTQASCCVLSCMGVDVHPTVLWNGNTFISVNLPAGWTWYWDPITNLMRYNCTPYYPNGVSCGWSCSTIEARVGYAVVRASGDGRYCDVGIQGNQTLCPLPTSTPVSSR
jgi:hypothetical protein